MSENSIKNSQLTTLSFSLKLFFALLVTAPNGANGKMTMCEYAGVAISVCISDSVPLWQIRIFGYFFMPNPDIRIFMCRPTAEN